MNYPLTKSANWLTKNMLAIVFGILLCIPTATHANDYLEKTKHYNAYANGADKVHFVIPVWAYGAAYDYYAYEDSYIAYTENGGSETRIAWYKTDKYGENEKENSKGTAYIKLLSGQGTIIVTSMANGVNYRVTKTDDWTEALIVKQKEDDGYSQVTMLEFDWYPPESLDGKEFSVSIVSKFRRSYTEGNAMTCNSSYSGFIGKSNIMTPQLYMPYIYQVNDEGPTGYGYAAIPYMTFNDPISYTTSLDPGEVKITNRGGTLYVMTNDTVQEQFKATFKMWRNQANNDTTTKTSTGVDIPPYHRIYNLTATQEQDSTGTFTGNNIIKWTVKNPALKDLVEGDYFELQRALQKDFSDAGTIDVVQMLRGDNKAVYTSIDNNRASWTGNADTENIQTDTRFSVSDPKYVLYDKNNEPLAELNVKLVSEQLRVPAVPVYYRIRRASASVWGWDIDFTKTATLLNYNFLAPLAETQDNYTLDEDFQNNHKVHFRFVIENKEPTPVTPQKDKCTLSCGINRILKEDSVSITLQFRQELGYVNPEGTTQFRITKDDGDLAMDWTYLTAGTYLVPRNCNVQIRNTAPQTDSEFKDIITYKIIQPSIITCISDGYIHGQSSFDTEIKTDDTPPLTPDKGEGDVDVAIQFEQKNGANNPEGTTAFKVTLEDGTVVKDWTYLPAGLYQFPMGCTIDVMNNDSRNYDGTETASFVIDEPSIITCTAEGWIHGSQEITFTKVKNEDITDGITKEINNLLYTVKDSLYTLMLNEHNTLKYGRAMWDRSAQLILTRTMEETNQTFDFIIPQDSIKRQADGSWVASFVDVAEKACTHYKYAVRIDQSKADLHVQDSSFLKPILITGPELYYDEGAKVQNLTITKGDATTAMKNGVLLRWETNTNNFDYFVVLRKKMNSTAAADTIIKTTQSNFLDRSAVPDIHYEYTVEAHYTCNGKISVNAASAEGWRTPYGEISGTILMPDNSGMAGVTVVLQDEAGNKISDFITDASGAYKFDSLKYTLVSCEDPTIQITTQNVTYRNSIMIRVMDANGIVLEDWANKSDGTYTYKTGTVIEAKTTYSSDQSYNQIFSFTINKHCGLTIYTSQIIGRPGVTHFNFSEYDDCACSETGENYIIVPTSQYGNFSFNNTSAGTAAVNLSASDAVANGIDFVNTSSTRLTGRVLYKGSTIPVSGAMFRLNGDTVRRGNNPITTGIDGNFELLLPLSQPCKLQVIKTGHTFEGDGILHVEDGADTFALTQPRDGVRFYDTTKVRLTGRVAGGNDQRDLQHGFGLGNNNIGDNVQLVLQLEGDNTAHLVHDPDDLTRDSVHQFTQHLVFSTNSDNVTTQRNVGITHTLFEKKRITIHPDSATGEFEVDLFPVKYKVVQATANGYATLFASGQGSETFDLTNATAVEHIDSLNNEWVKYNAVYDRIYHTPMQVNLKQMIYGLERKGLGEPSMEVSNIDPSLSGTVNMYEEQQDGTINYLLGYPAFIGGRKYQFMAEAYEDYYYNNDHQVGKLDRVPLRGGSVTIHNGLCHTTATETYKLDKQGRYNNIWLMVDKIDVNNVGNDALRTISVALEQEGNVVDTKVLKGYVTGTVVQQKDLRMTDADIVLLDIVRDPAGSGSSSWIESGSTYSYSYKNNFKWEVGANINLKYGLNVSMDVGLVTAPAGAGSYQGSTYTTSKQLSFPIPISHKWDWGYQYDYSITTTERISTSSSATPKGVGEMADVFFGTTVSQIAGKAKTIAIIGDSLYNLRKPAFDAGMMKVIAQGTATGGKQYYLVTGQKIVLGSTINNSFAYTQHYILNTVIPEIALERQNLLMQFGSLTEAKAAANAIGEEVYWYHPEAELQNINDTLPSKYYEMVTPDDDKIYTNRVAALNNMLLKWMTIIYQNEKEKTSAIGSSSMKVGTYSVSYGATMTHSDSYTASANYNEVPQGWDLVLTDVEKVGTQAGKSILNNLCNNMKSFWNSRNGSTFGTAAVDALANYEYIRDDNGNARHKNDEELGTVTNTSKFSMSFEPILNFDNSYRESDTRTIKKSAGFNIVADADGDITVACYRVPYKAWSDSAYAVLSELNTVPQGDDALYGSYVFITEAGATFCPHQDEVRTQFYNKGTLIGNSTQWIVKPEMTADTYEIANVQPNNKATFRLQLMNNAEIDAGIANKGSFLTLMLDGTSNPYGAKVSVDGMPLTQGSSYWVVPGTPVIKTVEIERGTVDDYDNLVLYLYASDCPKTSSTIKLSVHFLPVASDVNIASPRQNWIMNTLSAHDSVGYYIPVDINGFDIHHKNFDHIEFQYKLTTQSEDDWVNQCSFYANDSLYSLATGNKAMIENGRIAPFRFYGERDPMEQKYDLRAVTFCRYGSGFVTKSSPVISGTKDTRPPRVFGEPEPVNAILGIGENLKLRFNEPIAGNYLDEDNNFQLLGITNETGITTNASVHFDGSPLSYASTQVSRSLDRRSFSIDMLVKPTSQNKEQRFFQHGLEDTGVAFGLTADNRLQLQLGTFSIYSKHIPEPMLDFTRVIMTYNYANNTVHFYVGKLDITDPEAPAFPDIPYTLSAPLVFGRSMEGNMLEVRLWTKALTPEDIAATHLRYLTGYEQELAAYYMMNEGTGTTLQDRSSGATMTMQGATWNLPKGISLALGNNDNVTLAKNLLARSSAYDGTYMLWFRNTSANGTILSMGDKKFTIKDGNLQWEMDSTIHQLGAVGLEEWHHLVLSINRTYNNVAIYLDSKMVDTYAANKMTGIGGDIYLGGDGFEGNVDEFVLFEQALPKNLIEEFGNNSPSGDEMGLMAYLPFEEQKTNSNGILELVFSGDDQRTYRDPNGNVIDKKVTLALSNSGNTGLEALADKTIYAPVRRSGLLSKLNFDWAFNQDELLINLKMADREINKQTVCVTVRDVEDLNGNPMPSPVMWVAYVDHNSLKWDYRNVEYTRNDSNNNNEQNFIDVTFTNQSGRRHQYSIESLPYWLNVDAPSGSVGPTEYKTLKLIFSSALPIGTYTDLIYLTDENGLTEPLRVEYTIKAECPWNEPDQQQYQLNMSLCGQVKIDDEYDTDARDKVIALYRNECVGMANITFDNITNKSEVFITIYGNETMSGKKITFQLWQASTGKIISLNTSSPVTFAHGNVFGCDDTEPLLFTAGNSEVQNITLQQGWNWTSFNINVNADATGVINNVMTAADPWTEGDLIKNPVTRNFCTYSDSLGRFAGSLIHFRYIYTHMIYCHTGNIMRVSGDKLPADSMRVTLRGGGLWSPLPCLFNEAKTVTEALADYFDYASPGDLVKSHDQFAVFSQDRKWIGNLTSIRPGKGYLFRRMGENNVTIYFYNNNGSRQTRRAENALTDNNVQHDTFNNPLAASNMTVIAKLEAQQADNAATIEAFVGNERAAVANAHIVGNDTLYFITVQSDMIDKVRFSTKDGQALHVDGMHDGMLNNIPNTHHGSLASPILLKYGDATELPTQYPANVKYYSATGKLIGELKDAQSELQIREFLNNLSATAGIYNAVINCDGKVKTIKMMKQ